MTTKSAVANAISRAKKRNLPFDLHEVDVLSSLAYFKYRCAYCQEGLTKTNLELDHIVPLAFNDDLSGSSYFNILPTCRICNRAKRDTSLGTWLEKRFLNHEEISERIFLYLLQLVEFDWQAEHILYN